MTAENQQVTHSIKVWWIGSSVGSISGRGGGFLQKKKELGEPRGDDDFEKLAELGAGNGGN